MKFNNKLRKSLLCIFLSFVMVFSVLLVGCNNVEEGTEAGNEEKVEIVRALEDISANVRIVEANVEVVSVNKADLPEGAILAKEDVVGKFTTVNVYAGEYFLPAKLSSKRVTASADEDEPEDDGILNFDDAGYVIVTDYVKPDTGEDVADAIQKLINDNPNRTLYFPDGEYILSKTITTSADPSKTVSFKLSNYAHFMPAATWTIGDNGETLPLFHLGATDMAEGIVNEGNHYSLEGGIFDGKNVADAIWVENAGDVSLRYISIKDAFIGIHVKGDAEGNGPTVDVHTVNIVGTGHAKNVETGEGRDSIGVILDSNSNTLTNMRIANNQISIMLTGSDNFLRNLHPLYTSYRSSAVSNWQDTYNNSVAFYDIGTRNFYDNCYNDQFAVGFYMGKDTASIYDCCFNFWYRGTAANDKNVADHIAFKAEGKFNSTIRYNSADFTYGKPVLSTDEDGNITKDFPTPSNCAFLIVGEAGGEGVIETVYYQKGNVCADDAALDYCVDMPIG